MAKNNKYFVRCQWGTGAAYLCTRLGSRRVGKYRWNKGKREEAALLTYSAARKAAINYGGNAIICG